MSKPRDNPLEDYQAKRDFAATSEPASGGVSESGKLFVIHKHWASKLHYDFRLELSGTMKSWAIPKGPSLDPNDKRMALAVEDHPISYATFEGNIPAKQYGAGKVIIWDYGTWEPVGRAEAGLRAGSLKFRLQGQKLRGLWALVRMKTRDNKRGAWLLIKERDDAARAASEFSVVDECPDSVIASNDPLPTKREAKVRDTKLAKPAAMTPSKARGASIASNAEGADVMARLPDSLQPQLPIRVDKPPANEADWQYEIKFDGYRILARVEAGQVKFFTRNNKDWTSKLRYLVKAIATAKYPDGWYDGEIVVLDANGVPDFGALQGAFATSQAGDVVLYLFDLPYHDGRDLRALPLEQRRALLKTIVTTTAIDMLRFSETFAGTMTNILGAACNLGLEGVIGKRRGSRYVSQRSSDWIKLKCGERQEFVVGGFTDPGGSRDEFGALLLGIHQADGSLSYAGKVGSGFSDASLREISKKLKPLHQASSPFVRTPLELTRAHWVKPKMLVEVSFIEWTKDEHLRNPVFRGVRIDKEAKMIRRESPTSTPVERPTQSTPASKQTLLVSPSLTVTHGERIVDETTGLTKLELIRYYTLVGALMMPHLKQRPVSLVRAPAGFAGELFFQKHVDKKLPTGFATLDPALDPGHAPLVTVATAAGLAASAQWSVVEFHTSNALTTNMERPNRLIFDLDPGVNVTWPQVQQAAELVHAFLTELDLICFAKTSGGKGIHIVVPIMRRYEWAVAKDFAHAIVSHLARTLPAHFVDKSGPKNRVGKIFIDYLRNGRGATTVSAWSARVRPGAGVSVPIAWSEVSRIRSADYWTVRNIHSRLDQGNAPWAGYDKAANRLTRAMRILDYQPQTDAKRSGKVNA